MSATRTCYLAVLLLVVLISGSSLTCHAEEVEPGVHKGHEAKVPGCGWGTTIPATPCPGDYPGPGCARPSRR
ncbi:hypothetical protein GQ55_8G224200 [Panicum hallii var. hallii]|uniref:Uncharacterized protein n=1 Tax=Panicum hallii var. hallii TaxID=1504633 RepID=A0A2T7CQ20_9POAL|nr:hypothetical protein GQ55_8G224200 [Panicum hallii var. hallii]